VADRFAEVTLLEQQHSQVGVRSCQAGIDGQGLAMVLHGLGSSPRGGQRDTQVGVRRRKIRIDRKRPFEVSDRFAVLAACVPGEPHVVVGERIVRLQFERGAKYGHAVVQCALTPKSITEVRVRFGLLRCDADRFPVADDRLVELSTFVEDGPQVIECQP